MNFQTEVRNTLLRLGVSKAYMGYEYVVYGTSLVMEDETCLDYITKTLYVDIATKFHTTCECVERNIRTVIATIWKTKNRELLKLICGGAIHEKPTNKEFFLYMNAYVLSLNVIEQAAADIDMGCCCNNGDCVCPKDGALCNVVMLLYKRISEMERKNTMLCEIQKQMSALL